MTNKEYRKQFVSIACRLVSIQIEVSTICDVLNEIGNDLHKLDKSISESLYIKNAVKVNPNDYSSD